MGEFWKFASLGSLVGGGRSEEHKKTPRLFTLQVPLCLGLGLETSVAEFLDATGNRALGGEPLAMSKSIPRCLIR